MNTASRQQPTVVLAIIPRHPAIFVPDAYDVPTHENDENETAHALVPAQTHHDLQNGGDGKGFLDDSTTRRQPRGYHGEADYLGHGAGHQRIGKHPLSYRSARASLAMRATA